MSAEVQPFDIVQFLRTVAAARLVKIEQGEIIYSQGVPGEYLYYIASGKVRLSVASSLARKRPSRCSRRQASSASSA